MEDTAIIQCATCFEPFEITIDPTGGAEQEFVIDCEICCRPMTVRLAFDEEGNAFIDVRAD